MEHCSPNNVHLSWKSANMLRLKIYKKETILAHNVFESVAFLFEQK